MSLYAVGCSKIHSSAEVDSANHMKLLMAARLSGACGVSSHALPDLKTINFFHFYPTLTLHDAVHFFVLLSG